VGSEGKAAAEAEPAGGAPASAGIARCVCVLDGPVLTVEGATAQSEIGFGILFPQAVGGAGVSTIFALQQGHDSSVCPAGKTILHLSAQAIEGVTAQAQLQPALEMLLAQQAAAAATARESKAHAQGDEVVAEGDEADNVERLAKQVANRVLKAAVMEAEVGAEVGAEVVARPDAAALAADGLADVSVLWGCYFHLLKRRCLSGKGRLANVLTCDDLPVGVDSDVHVERAKALFHRICPGAPFLPSAEDDDATQAMDDSTEERPMGGGAAAAEPTAPLADGEAVPSTSARTVDDDAMRVE